MRNTVFGISIQRERGQEPKVAGAFPRHRAVTHKGPSGGLGQRGLLVSPGWPSSPAFVCLFGHLFTHLDYTPSPHCTGFNSVLPKAASFPDPQKVTLFGTKAIALTITVFSGV